jgi:hypothetical protein
MFFPGSRYLTQNTYATTDASGNPVRAVQIPLPVPTPLLGYVRRTPTRRLDSIAAQFLADATTFWRLCDANGVMVPDALAARDLVGIPIDAPGR